MLNLDDLEYILAVLDSVEESDSVAYKKVNLMIRHAIADDEFRKTVTEIRQEFDEIENK